MTSFKSQQEFGAGGSSLLFLGVGDRGLNGAAVHKERVEDRELMPRMTVGYLPLRMA